MRFLKIKLLALFTVTSLVTYGQNTDCKCGDVFKKLTEKLEANYVGYHLLKSKADADYQALKLKYGALSQNTGSADCTALLQGFLSFFKDGHLFVTEYPKFSEADMASIKAKLKSLRFNINSLSVSGESSFVGYWTDGVSKFLITKNPANEFPFEYVAVIIEGPDSTKIGEIKFGLNKNNEGTYYTANYSSRYVKVNVYKENTLLSIWGGITWGRLESADTPLFNPTATTIKKVDNNTLLITIPSFLINISDFNNLLLANEKEIVNTKNLIIDIRGNTGGNGIYFDLISTYYDKPVMHEKGYSVSSDDNIAYFEKFITKQKNDPYIAMVDTMKAKKNNTLVTGPDFGTLKLEPTKTNIKKVIILTDRGCMSASETFVLYSKAASSRVITMGDNTGGVVDYNNINLIPLPCSKQGIYFGYPTYSLNKQVVKNGYNFSGIPPDIKIDSSVPDKISFVLKYLNEN